MKDILDEYGVLLVCALVALAVSPFIFSVISGQDIGLYKALREFALEFSESVGG